MSLQEAMTRCFVRGYIARKSKPNDKYWKNGTRNGVHFYNIPSILSIEDKIAIDWNTYDSEGEETSVIG